MGARQKCSQEVLCLLWASRIAKRWDICSGWYKNKWACGGTGIRVRFRTVCRKAWRFESSHAHHSEFVKEVASGLRPSALVSAKKFQGVLNSAKRIPAESRRFPNKVWIVPKAQEPMRRDFQKLSV